MIVRVTKRGVYVPEWNGNRELPEADQVRVRWRHLTYEETEELAIRFDVTKKKDYLAFKDATYALMTEGIEGYVESDEGGNEIPVRTWEDLRKVVSGPTLIHEMRQFYDRLEAIDKKKSLSAST